MGKIDEDFMGIGGEDMFLEGLVEIFILLGIFFVDGFFYWG